VAMKRVRFRYLTGIKRDAFQNARLTGSWDAGGRFSNTWSTIPMAKITAEDGCPAFEASVDFPDDQAGWWFRWGVIIDAPSGANLWGIPTEVKVRDSTERVRVFWLDGGPGVQEQDFYLSLSRWLGAQPFSRAGTADPCLRFAAWAPNARQVDVVMGMIWDATAAAPTPLKKSIPYDEVAGGYIGDKGQGTHPGFAPFLMTEGPDSVWTTDPSEPRLKDYTAFDHQVYIYRVTKDSGTVAFRTDLYSRCQMGSGNFNPAGSAFTGLMKDLDGSVGCSTVINPDTVTKFFEETKKFDGVDKAIFPEETFIPAKDFWHDEFNQAKPVPRRVEDLVNYELHLGALGFGRPGPGTMQDALDLVDYLVDLGVNAVELLPMSQFGGDDANWGYATSHYFAIEYSGGGRDKFKFFIKKCHQNGIAVIVDVVYNHFVHQAERAEWLYDTDAPEKSPYYWYEGRPSDYPDYEFLAAHPAPNSAPAPGQGGFVDNVSTAYAPAYHQEMVRKLFISSAVALIEEFHVDGFRADQTTSIREYNMIHADAVLNGYDRNRFPNVRGVPDANIYGAKLLREWTRTLKTIKPDIMLMAEDHSQDEASVTRSPDAGGLGFDAAWYANYHHHLVGLNYGPEYAKLIPTAGQGTDIPLAMGYFAGALGWTGSGKVVYHVSHDEAGNAGHDNGDPTTRSHRTIVAALARTQPDDPITGLERKYAEARCRFAFGVTVLSAGTPMFLFGEEVGFQRDFLYNMVLANREDLKGKRDGDGKHLFAFYSAVIKLRLSPASPGLRSRDITVLHTNDAGRVIVFRRRGSGQEYLVLASLSNTPYRSGYIVWHPEIPAGFWREIFNSDSVAYGGNDVGNFGATIPSQAGRFEAVIPANGLVVFQKV